VSRSRRARTPFISRGGWPAAGAGELPGLPAGAFEDLDEDVGGLLALGLGDGALDELADALEAAHGEEFEGLGGGVLHAAAHGRAGVRADHHRRELARELGVARLVEQHAADRQRGVDPAVLVDGDAHEAEGRRRALAHPDSMYQAPSCSIGCM